MWDIASPLHVLDKIEREVFKRFVGYSQSIIRSRLERESLH